MAGERVEAAMRGELGKNQKWLWQTKQGERKNRDCKLPVLDKAGMSVMENE